MAPLFLLVNASCVFAADSVPSQYIPGKLSYDSKENSVVADNGASSKIPIDGAIVPYAGDDILQHPPLGHMKQHVIGHHGRDTCS